jgi:hypothetical protein
MTNDLYTLTNEREGTRYELKRGTGDLWCGMYLVTRVWLADNEREYMGAYDKNAARKYWDSLVASGFVKA